MDRAELKQKIKETLVRELDLEGVAPSQIEDGAPLFGAGLGLDSLDALQLAMAVEEHFGVQVPDGEQGRAAFASVDALADYITTHK